MKRLRFTALGFLVAGVVWDLIYHIVLFFRASDLPPLLDFVGNLGHAVTLAGIVLVLLYISRVRSHGQGQRPRGREEETPGRGSPSS